MIPGVVQSMGERRSRRCAISVLAIAVLVAYRPPLSAQQPVADTVRMGLADARALAVGRNPELLAARLDTAVAQGELRQASLLVRSNPAVDVLSAGAGLGYELGISQEVEILNQRGARRTAARLEVERARASAADVARVVLGRVDLSFYRLVAAARRQALAQEVLDLSRRLAEVAGRQLEAGKVSRLDYNLATVEFGRSRARNLAAGRERAEAEIELTRLLGLPRGTVIAPKLDGAAADSARDWSAADSASRGGLSASAARLNAVPDGRPTSPVVDSLTAVALSRRPDLAERQAAQRRAVAQGMVVRREAFPNLLLRAASEKEGGGTRALRTGVGLTLPVFNRNQGEAAAWDAQARRAGHELAAVSDRVRAEVASAVTTYESAAREMVVLATTVLGPARQNRQLSETAYREGKIGLAELLLIRGQAIDAELDYWAAWQAAREASATLAEVTAQNLLDTGIRKP